ncbi:PAAR domain-containing protein [Sporomusa sp. KB1]|jgi:uncharacterized Zn-binding protein involved in type VI secretion|uniref:PAAR domain-containing protein n=1 Tax=Sporomusa sp. KB1 TaxID=943346 RepID=UPI0011A73D0D|nr:PAAR domain-containing protein [Sporomusa sp. KB1]TWH45889.1 putative Zn-binding protein involved in type VI secretion [Sporomusa sp. KB1]
MPAVTRRGDGTTGICNPGLPCCPHGRSGTNQEASPNVFVNGLPLHRKGDSGPTNCPHGGIFESVAGSATVMINGHPATRIGDATTCQICGQPGSHTSASPNVFIGG